MRVFTLNGRTATVINVVSDGVVDVKLDHPYMNGWGRTVEEERAFTTQLRFADEDGRPTGECGDVRLALVDASVEQKNEVRHRLSLHAGHPVAETVRDRMNKLRLDRQSRISVYDVISALRDLDTIAA